MIYLMGSGKLILIISFVVVFCSNVLGADDPDRGIVGTPGSPGPPGIPGPEGVSCYIGRKRRHNDQLQSIEDPQKYPIGPSPLVLSQRTRRVRQLNKQEICAPGCVRGREGPPGEVGPPGIRGPPNIRSFSSSARRNPPAPAKQRALPPSRAKRTESISDRKHSAVKRQSMSRCEMIPACMGPSGLPGPMGPPGPQGPCYYPN